MRVFITLALTTLIFVGTQASEGLLIASGDAFAQTKNNNAQRSQQQTPQTAQDKKVKQAACRKLSRLADRNLCLSKIK